MSVIYRITCTANGKFYVGSTVNKKQRWNRHRRELRAGVHKNLNMQASWNKYGEAAFVFEVLEELADPAMLFAAEQKYLDEHAGKDHCFNWSRHADAPMRGRSGEGTPNFGRVFGPETRARISAATTGDKHPNWGKPLPETTREKIREANKTNPWKGAKHTLEAIAKIAAASKSRPITPETREKMAAARRGKPISLEQRLRISQTLSGPGNFWYGKQRPESFVEKIRKSVVARDPDGVETVYVSIQALREALQVGPGLVNRTLKSGKPVAKGPRAGWTFSYHVT